MHFSRRRPVSPLDLFVESLWVCHGDAGPRRYERVLPSGAPQLVVNLAEDETRVYREASTGLVCVTVPGSILSGLTSRAQIIDTDEQSHVAGVSFRPGGTVPFVALPADQARVAGVTPAVGLSEKRFIERFKAEVGVTPKRYCRLQRFQQLVTSAHAVAGADWADLAVSCGYADQSHLIHEFREFAGMTPRAYTESKTAFQNHVSFLQS